MSKSKEFPFLSHNFLCALCVLCGLFIPSIASGADQTIAIPMRDQTELLTDLYLPDANPQDSPCILLRSPAGRQHPVALHYAALSKHGYVVAIQETRSFADPEGKTFPYWNDGWGQEKDGYDTVEWLAKSPYTNGKIGTAGVSALGITQLMMAPAAPPSLKCQHVGMAVGSLYHHALRPGGQFLKNQVEGWLHLYAPDPGVLSYASTRPFYNEFWENFDTCVAAPKVQVPGLLYTGWYDTFLQGTIDAFVSRQENGGEGAKGNQKLIIGPWTHMWPQSNQLGDFEVPPLGQVPPVDFSPSRWFDYYLKGEANGANAISPVTYYVMGPFDGTASSGNKWRTAEQWPVPSKQIKFYLVPSGALTETMPVASKQTISYTSDPANPVPTKGGRNLFIESGPKDQKEIEERSDVLVFTTEPFEEDIEITGRIFAKLFITTNKKDSDIALRLSDVYPDGRSFLIADGLTRLGVVDGSKPAKHLTGTPREVEIDLWSTSIVIAKGHRIRISVSGSNYPRYELNSNIGFVGTNTGFTQTARNTLHFGKQYPSQLLLPVVQ